MKKRKGFKILFGFVVFTGVLAAVMLFSPLFLISDIHVNDLSKYTAEEIIRVTGLEKDENVRYYMGGSLRNVLQLRMGKAESRVENLPWVRTAEVQYLFPGTVQITVTERNAIAWVRYMANYLLVDEEGYVLEVSSSIDDRYPEIRGVQLDKFSVGKKIVAQKPEKIDWLVQLLQSLEQVDQSPHHKLGEVLDWVDFLQDKELFLSLDSRITAKLELDDDLTYRLSYLKELYYNYIKPEEKGMIDFFDKICGLL